jgi:LacI family transcriptional regulator
MNIKEFAKLTGYSTATVSRALNGKKCVSDEAKRKIFELQKKYNFYLNKIGRSLSIKKTYTIGITLPHFKLPSFEDIFFPAIVKGMEEILSNNGYDLLLLTSYEKQRNENDYVRLFIEKSIDGLILLNIEKEDKGFIELEKTDFPYVAIGRVLDIHKGSYVDTNNVKRTYIAVEHFIKEHGIKKIGYIGGELKYFPNIDNFNGYKLALLNNGIEMKEKYVFTVPQDIEEGYNAMKKIMKEKVEGVVIYGNLIVRGVIECLMEKKIKVPDEIKIILISEDLPFYLPDVKFTRVEQDITGLGEMAIKILLEQIKTGKKIAKQIVLQPKLVKGNSCGC